MKALKTKVILSAFVLLFALVATIGSTYAWFTVSQTVTVSGLELDVQSDESLLVLVDGWNYPSRATTTNTGYVYSGTASADDNDFLNAATNYGVSIDNSMITRAGLYANMGTYTLGTVTAAAGNSDGSDLAYTHLGTGAATNVVTLTTLSNTLKTAGVSSSNSTTADYIEISFWLLSQSSTAEDVVLEDLVFSTVAANSSAQDVVVDALRLMTHSTGSGDLIFSTDPDYGFAFTTGLPGFDAPAAWGNSLEAGTLQPLLVSEHSLFYDVDVTNVSAATLGAADVLVTLQPNVPQKVTVSIYIEGWDAEAATTILNAGFTVGFKFSLQDLG